MYPEYPKLLSGSVDRFAGIVLVVFLVIGLTVGILIGKFIL